MVLVGVIIGAIVIAGAITAWYVGDKSAAEGKATVIKAEGEAKALEKGTSKATSTDIGFGLYKQEQAFESGKEKSNVIASTGTKTAQVQAGEDTTTGAAATRTKTKSEEEGALGATAASALGGFDMGGMAKIAVYGVLMVMIFMIIRK